MHKKSAEQKKQWRRFRRGFGQNLKTIRQAQGISLDELSDITGYSTLTLARWEGTRLDIDLKTLFHLAEALNVPPALLMK